MTTGLRCWVRRCSLLFTAALGISCGESPAPQVRATIGQWIWTRTDLARFSESRAQQPGLEAALFIGYIQCDTISKRLLAHAGLSASEPHAESVPAVIRFEDGLERCRVAASSEADFAQRLDSAVYLLRRRARSVPLSAIQLDYDAPRRALGKWAASVEQLQRHALRGDTVWVTSLIAHLRDPSYGALFRGVVRGHVLQVFDTGEPATTTQVDEAVRLARRARIPFRIGLGAFERETRSGRTDHRGWFATVAQFKSIDGFRGVWIFPGGQRWISLLTQGT